MRTPPTRSGQPVPIRGARLAADVLHVSVIGSTTTGSALDDPAWRGYRAKATETEVTVALLVRELRPLADLPPGHGLNRAGRSLTLPVHLTRPLGEREVVDRANGSPVPVLRNLMTLDAPGWTLRAEAGRGFSWEQWLVGTAGTLALNQGSPGLGTVSPGSSFSRRGTTTVRGSTAEWTISPGQTSIHWIENRHGIQLHSGDLDLTQLLAIAHQLTSGH